MELKVLKNWFVYLLLLSLGLAIIHVSYDHYELLDSGESSQFVDCSECNLKNTTSFIPQFHSEVPIRSYTKQHAKRADTPIIQHAVNKHVIRGPPTFV